ncbi:MAG: FecR family protein, partial [Elusimicrobia bacterium]|nr:FecR family protein [Elusimicrobiota bacterium]
MKRKTTFLFLLLMLPAFAMAEEAKLIAFNGKVEVRPGREGKWAAARRNMNVTEGGAVRTAAGASAVVLLPNKTKVWMKESSNLELEQRQTLASRLALVFGRIKLRVPHLLRKEKFEVRTPSAVCAVRGTEFTVETDEIGRMNLNVLYGEVKLNFVVPPERGLAEIYIPQGRTLKLEEKGRPGKVGLMTAGEERNSLENWNPGLKPEERQKELRAKENDRTQIREFAKVTNNSEASVKTFLNNVKEADLEAGRTLRDVHG